MDYTRRNYPVPLPEAASLEELNQELLEQCVRSGEHEIQHHNKPVNGLFEEKRPHLLCLPDVGFSNVQALSDMKVDKYSTVIVEQNHYCMPSEYMGFNVQVLLRVSIVQAYYKHNELTLYERVYGKNNRIMFVEHYLKLFRHDPQAFDSARAIKQWREHWPVCLEALLKRFCQRLGRTHGIKDFICVLLLYRGYSADEIEAAVE